MNVVGTVPEFTTDDVVDEEVKPTLEVEETETPSEPPAEEQPVSPKADEDAELAKVNQALQEERAKLLREISELRGQRREIKQDQLQRVEAQIDELKDVHPNDQQIIEKVLRSKGLITRQEAESMFYKAVQDDALNAFLQKYPEYKPENDPNDLRWSRFKAEYESFKNPSDPHQIPALLEKVHRLVSPASTGDRTVAVKKRQVETASVGGGGVQRSSSGKSLDPQTKEMYRRGGWSEEEIADLEQNL